MVYKATVDSTFKGRNLWGTEEKLHELSKSEAFDKIVTAEVAFRKLVKQDVLQRL